MARIRMNRGTVVVAFGVVITAAVSGQERRVFEEAFQQTGRSIRPLRSSGVPRFEDYRVKDIYRGRVAPPRFGDLSRDTGTDLRCFGEDPSWYSGKAVNFAGHFVIDACSCGSGCHYLYMWDALTGRVWHEFPAMPVDVGPFFDGAGAREVQYKGEEFHANSSLLVIEGCVEDTCDCARRYYQWTGSAFRLIRKEPVGLPPRCGK